MKKVLSKSSINHCRSSPSSRSTSVLSSFSDSLFPCSSPSLYSSSSFSFLRYSTLSKLPVHLQRSVQSNDNILHWQSSPHKARRHLQVMSSNMCSGAGLRSIQTISNLPSLSCQPCLIGECGSKLVFKACFETSNW